MQVAEAFTGSPGKYVDLPQTIDAFKGVLAGKYDDLPEMAFYMVRVSPSWVTAVKKMVCIGLRKSPGHGRRV